jgi:hypothetical protein
MTDPTTDPAMLQLQLFNVRHLQSSSERVGEIGRIVERQGDGPVRDLLVAERRVMMESHLLSILRGSGGAMCLRHADQAKLWYERQFKKKFDETPADTIISDVTSHVHENDLKDYWEGTKRSGTTSVNPLANVAYALHLQGRATSQIVNLTRLAVSNSNRRHALRQKENGEYRGCASITSADLRHFVWCHMRKKWPPTRAGPAVPGATADCRGDGPPCY